MPAQVRLLTDSAAHFLDPDFPAQHHVTVAPMQVQVGQDLYPEGVRALGPFFHQVATTATAPRLVPPPPPDFTKLYEAHSRDTGLVLALLSSGKLSPAPRHARAGAEQVLGRCKVQVIDSLTTSVGLGFLVQEAALAAEQGASLPELVRLVRGLIPRLYSIFFVESLDYLAQAGRLSKAQAVLGAMLGIKPFLTFDEGNLVPMEKVRHRAQAIEKMAEFVFEFAEIEHLGILHDPDHPAEDTDDLLERLAVDFPDQTWPVVTYQPSLAALLGPGAMGIMVLENENALDPDNAFHADYDDEE